MIDISTLNPSAKKKFKTHFPTSYQLPVQITIVPRIKYILEGGLLQSPTLCDENKSLMLPFRSSFRSIPGLFLLGCLFFSGPRWPMGWPHHAECESCHDLSSSSICPYSYIYKNSFVSCGTNEPSTISNTQHPVILTPSKFSFWCWSSVSIASGFSAAFSFGKNGMGSWVSTFPAQA